MGREILLAIVAMIAFGITGIIYKMATDHIDPFSLTLFIYIFAAAFTALTWYFYPSSNKVITRQGITWTALAAVFVVIGMISYISAIKIGQASVVVPIRNLAFVVTAILAIILLREGLSLAKVTGILFAVLALILLSIQQQDTGAIKP